MELGDYVFATKYRDGDPADGWALGFFDGMLPKVGGDRFMVVDDKGNQFRGNGFRRCERITPDEGEAIIKADKDMLIDGKYYPTGINMWDILEDYRKSKMQRNI